MRTGEEEGQSRLGLRAPGRTVRNSGLGMHGGVEGPGLHSRGRQRVGGAETLGVGQRGSGPGSASERTYVTFSTCREPLLSAQQREESIA